MLEFLPEPVRSKIAANWGNSFALSRLKLSTVELAQIRDAIKANEVLMLKGKQEVPRYATEANLRKYRKELIINAIILERLGLTELPKCEYCGRNRVLFQKYKASDGKLREITFRDVFNLTDEQLLEAVQYKGKWICPICKIRRFQIDKEAAKENAVKGVQAFKKKMQDPEYRERFREAHREAAKRVNHEKAAIKRQQTLLVRYGTINAAHIYNTKHKKIVECLLDKGIPVDKELPKKIVVQQVLTKSDISKVEPLVKDFDKLYRSIQVNYIPLVCKRCGLKYARRAGKPIDALDKLICHNATLEQVWPCKNCDKTKSRLEAKLALKLQKLGLDVRLNVRKNGFEYDLEVSYNDRKVYIDLHGEFWHSDEYIQAFDLPYDELHHKIVTETKKLEAEAKQKLTVIRLWDFQLEDSEYAEVNYTRTFRALKMLLSKYLRVDLMEGYDLRVSKFRQLDKLPSYIWEDIPAEFSDAEIYVADTNDVLLLIRGEKALVAFLSNPTFTRYDIKNFFPSVKQVYVPARYYTLGVPTVNLVHAKPGTFSILGEDEDKTIRRKFYGYHIVDL